MTTQARLILARTVPASVMEDYAALFEQFVAAPDTRSIAWLVVPSLQRRFPFPAANSPPWQLEAVLRALRSAGAGDITVWLPARDHSLHAYAEIIARYQAALSSTPAPYQAERPRGLLLLPTMSRGPVFALGGSCWLACQLMSQLHPAHTTVLNVLNTIGRTFEPIISLMDATTIGNGPPAHTSRPEVGNFLIGANDMLALDRFACTLLEIDSARFMPFLHAACRNSSKHALDTALYGDRELAALRFPVHRRGRHMRPNFHSWPPGDQRVYTGWLYETAWGRLFASYYQPRPGPVARAF